MTKKKTPKKKKSESFLARHKIPIFLFVLSFVVRLFFMEPALSHHDSIVNAQILEKLVEDGTLNEPVGGRYAFVFVNLIAYYPYYLITGMDADLFTRFSGVFFGALAMVSFYYFVRYFLKTHIEEEKATRIAFFSALLYSFTPSYLGISTTAKEHSMSVCFVLATFALALYAEERKSDILRATAAFFFIFSLSIREANLVFVPLYVLLVITQYMYGKKDWKKLMQVSLSHILPMITFFILLFYMYFGRVIMGAFKSGMELGRVSFHWWLPNVMKTALTDLTKSMTLSVALLSIIGIYLFRKHKWHLATLLLWFIGPLYYFSNTDGYTGRYLTFVIIPLTILAAVTLDRVYEYKKKWGIAFIVLVCVMLFASIYPLLDLRVNESSVQTMMKSIETHTQPNDIVFAGDWGPHVIYYTGRQVHQIPITRSQSEIRKYIERLKVEYKEGTNVYLMKVGLVYDAAIMRNLHRTILMWNFDFERVDTMVLDDFHHGVLKHSTLKNGLFNLTPHTEEWYEKTDNITIENIDMTTAVVIPQDVEHLLLP